MLATALPARRRPPGRARGPKPRHIPVRAPPMPTSRWESAPPTTCSGASPRGRASR